MFFEDLAGSCVGEYQMVDVTFFEAPSIEYEPVASYVEEYEPVAVTCFDHEGGVLQPRRDEDDAIRNSRVEAWQTCSNAPTETDAQLALPPTCKSLDISRFGLEGPHEPEVRAVFVPIAPEMAEPCLW